MSDAPARLNIAADLTVEVGGAVGSLTGAGRSLVFQADRPALFLSALPGSLLSPGSGRSVGRRMVGRLADQLAADGLSLQVRGPHGDLVRLGSGGSSWWGRRLTGSSAVRPGSVRSLGSLIWAMVSGSSRFREAVDTGAKAIGIPQRTRSRPR